MSRILVVDDELDIREMIAGVLQDENHETKTAKNSKEAFSILSEDQFDLVFLDIWLNDSEYDGLLLLDKIKKNFPNLPVVMISGHANIEIAVTSIHRGAYDFIEKPFKINRLIHVANKALEISYLKQQISDLKQKDSSLEIIGNSVPIQRLKKNISHLSLKNTRIMIKGPSGCGKKLVARKIHALSKRSKNKFITINVAEMSPEQMEIELFGTQLTNQKGKIGAFEKAQGGTLYIDEIADMPLATQNKFFAILNNKIFFRVGGAKPIKKDVRIFSSTSQPIEYLIQKGHFREDLYQYLSIDFVDVPPLIQYREDIPLLIDYFMDKTAAKEGLQKKSLSTEVIDILIQYNWPGNVRQLRNHIENLLILADQDRDLNEIKSDMLPLEFKKDTAVAKNKENLYMDMTFREAKYFFEKEYISAQISRFNGNISQTANFIGMERSALHRKLKKLTF